MLMDIEQEVVAVSEAISHAGYPFDLIIYALGYRYCNIADKVSEDEMAFTKKL